MPDSFNNFVHRTERVISTFSSLDQMPNLMDGLNVSLKVPLFQDDFELSINDEQFKLPNYNKYFDITDQIDDVKFESLSYWTHHYGLERKNVPLGIHLDFLILIFFFSNFVGMCSLVGVNLTTFDDTVLNATETAKENCWILFEADCSDQSRLSVFIKSGANASIAIKVYAGDDVIEYDPHENVEQIITVNGENKFKLNGMDGKEISLLSTLTPIKWVTQLVCSIDVMFVQLYSTI